VQTGLSSTCPHSKQINPISTTAQSFQVVTVSPLGVVVVCCMSFWSVAHLLGVNSNLLKDFIVLNCG
jgi:hypothetical protein